jgi:hypothetical protein
MEEQVVFNGWIWCEVEGCCIYGRIRILDGESENGMRNDGRKGHILILTSFVSFLMVKFMGWAHVMMRKGVILIPQQFLCAAAEINLLSFVKFK